MAAAEFEENAVIRANQMRNTTQRDAYVQPEINLPSFYKFFMLELDELALVAVDHKYSGYPVFAQNYR